MYSLAFEQRKFPKKHDYLVEDYVQVLPPLNVRDILGSLPPHNATNYLPWNPPTHPHLTVVPITAIPKTHPPRRWYFLCPVCDRRCEDLFPAYLGDTHNLKCRKCSGLIYASQRYKNKHHPLRKVLTSKKRISEQKKLARSGKRSAKNGRNNIGIIQPASWCSEPESKQVRNRSRKPLREKIQTPSEPKPVPVDRDRTLADVAGGPPSIQFTEDAMMTFRKMFSET